MHYPTLENCDQDNPREAFQWAMVAWPFKGSTPFIIQPQARADFAEMFWDLGFRHHPELQKKRVQAPFRGQQNALNPAVKVVDVNEPDHVMVLPDPSELTIHEQEAYKERIETERLRFDKNPETELARVENGDLFNPDDHSPSVVKGYLMACSKPERKRVLAAEMVGKKRDQILRNFKGE